MFSYCKNLLFSPKFQYLVILLFPSKMVEETADALEIYFERGKLKDVK